MVTNIAVRQTKRQSNRHQQQTNTQLFADRMSFLSLNRLTDWQTHRQTVTEQHWLTDRLTDNQTDRHTDRDRATFTDRKTGRQAVTERHSLTDRQTDRQTDRVLDRLTVTENHSLIDRQSVVAKQQTCLSVDIIMFRCNHRHEMYMQL